MKSILSIVVALGILESGCASSIPEADDALVATEAAVVNAHTPVLFVIRNPEDGQWVFLTEERSNRELVVFALFQDLAAFDSTLNQVRDLQVGWKATRPVKGAPWVREKFLSNQQLTADDSSFGKATSSRENSARHGTSTALPRFFITVFKENEGSRNVRQIDLQERSLAIWLVEGTHERTSTLLWRDSLTAVARREVDSLVQLCGLDTLKKDYADPLGSRGKEFLFSIWDTRAERSTTSRLHNCWVPALYELCVLINALLPKRYAMDLTLLKE